METEEVKKIVEQEMLTPLQRAQKELHMKRLKHHNEKAKALSAMYNERFNGYLQTYFNNFSEDEKENQISFDVLNKSWKKYCGDVNASQKYLSLKPGSFAEEVANIISKNPQFQKKDEVIDLTNLKTE
jgi:hypothetical protein